MEDSQNLKDKTQHELVRRIPTWLVSVSFSLIVGLLVISFFTGRKISLWPELGFNLAPFDSAEPSLQKLPIGAVIAFNSENCPEDDGWNEYIPAYGRFIRGIDKSTAEIDPEGERNPGHLQDDQFRSHNHTISKQKPLVHRDHGGGTGEDLDPGGWAAHTTLTIDASGGAETRPKNVSLLYCEKI